MLNWKESDLVLGLELQNDVEELWCSSFGLIGFFNILVCKQLWTIQKLSGQNQQRTKKSFRGGDSRTLSENTPETK